MSCPGFEAVRAQADMSRQRGWTVGLGTRCGASASSSPEPLGPGAMEPPPPPPPPPPREDCDASEPLGKEEAAQGFLDSRPNKRARLQAAEVRKYVSQSSSPPTCEMQLSPCMITYETLMVHGAEVLLKADSSP